MNEIKRKTFINRALQINQRTQEGLTFTEACKEISLPHGSYYHIIQFVTIEVNYAYCILQLLGISPAQESADFDQF